MPPLHCHWVGHSWLHCPFLRNIIAISTAPFFREESLFSMIASFNPSGTLAQFLNLCGGEATHPILELHHHLNLPLHPNKTPNLQNCNHHPLDLHNSCQVRPVLLQNRARDDAGTVFSGSSTHLRVGKLASTVDLVGVTRHSGLNYHGQLTFHTVNDGL